MEQAVAMGNPELWAHEGGIPGLVILALFVALGMFLYGQSKIYQMHRSDYRDLLKLHAEEREQWGKIVDARQQETNAAINSMAAALNRIASRPRRTDHDDHQDDKDNHPGGSYFQNRNY
jgi:hypothetical protein